MVPFSTRGDEKIVYNLSVREFMWLGAGGVLAVLFVAVPALLAGTSMTEAVVLLPLALPPLAAGAYFAFRRVRQFDGVATADVAFWRKLKYSRRCRYYTSVRRGRAG